MEWNDTGPIRPHDLFPGVAGSHTSKRPFKRDMAERIKTLYTSSPIVSTAVNQLVSYLTRTAITIEGDHADRITQEQIDYELQPAINKMMLEWILYGYTNVCKGKSHVNPGRSTINVVPFSLVQQHIEWDDNWHVKYTAETTDTMGKRKKSKIRVLCMYPPDENGTLDSPLAHCVNHLGYGEHLWMTYVTGSERGINPMFIFTQEQKTTGTLPGVERLPLNASIITSGGLGQVPMDKIVKSAESDAIEHTKKVLDEARTQRSESLAKQQLTREQAKRSGDRDVTFDTEQVLPSGLRGNMSVDPLGNMYLAPAGQSFSSGPEFKTPAEFTRVLEVISEELYRALGLPIIMLHGRADTSTSVEFSVDSLNASVTEMHKRASALISRVLTEFIGPDIKRDRVNAALAKDIVAIADSSSSSSSSSGAEAEILSDVKLSVSFVTSPVTSFELAQKVYQSGVISDDFYQEWALTILNLPETAKRENMVAWLKEQQESQQAAKRPRTQ